VLAGQERLLTSLGGLQLDGDLADLLVGGSDIALALLQT